MRPTLYTAVLDHDTRPLSRRLELRTRISICVVRKRATLNPKVFSSPQCAAQLCGMGSESDSIGLERAAWGAKCAYGSALLLGSPEDFTV